VTDVGDFPDKIKVLRLYKDGEPLMNRNLPEMIVMAKESGYFDTVDTTTNGALLTNELADKVLATEIDLINISVDGLDSDQFLTFTKAKVDFTTYVDRLRYLYENRGNTKIVIKTTREIIGEDREQEFLDTFGDMCDRIFVENTSPCWPEFDVEERMGIKIKEGLYGNEIIEQTACPYLFYSISVNSDMKVSACFVDWSRELIIGDLNTESLREVWNGDRMNAHRAAHLDGRRKEHPICGDCGQITHCGPDSIEGGLADIKSKFADLGLLEVGRAALPLVGYGVIGLSVIDNSSS